MALDAPWIPMETDSPRRCHSWILASWPKQRSSLISLWPICPDLTRH